MSERKLSEFQKEYRVFFLEKMRLYGVKSPAELPKEKKSEFFTEIKQDWAKHKLSKKQKKETYKMDTQTIVEESIEAYKEKTPQEIEKKPLNVQEWPQQEYPIQLNKEKEQQQSDKKVPRQEQERPPQEYTKQIITYLSL